MAGLVLIVLSLCSGPSTGPTSGPTGPSGAVTAFIRAVKTNDFATAQSMLQPIERPVRPDELELKLKRLANSLSDRNIEWVVLEERSTNATLSLVIVEERKKDRPAARDVDPLLLVHRDNRWRLMLDDPDQHGLTEEELKASNELLSWFKQRKKELLK